MIAPGKMVDPLLGRTISGRFKLIQRLGTGGMSSVYLARHVLIDRLMAIKTLRRDLAQDPVQRDRFIREARAVNRINHENIVEITDFGETTEDGLVYLVMEYVPGEPLLRVLGGGPLPLARAFDIAGQTASALARAHQMGIVHRDLKPENILIVQKRDRKDFVKLLDFGIAKIFDAPSLTGSQQIFGTPGYIAPEYIQSTAIDGRADLYSLGVIIYEMVTGALPFDYEYPGDLLVKHVTEMPIAPTQRKPDLPQAVEDFVLRCLAKDPSERFRDAYHFLSELRAVRERVGPDASWGGLNEEARVASSSDFHTTHVELPAIAQEASWSAEPARQTSSDHVGRMTMEYGAIPSGARPVPTARPEIPEPPSDDLANVPVGDGPLGVVAPLDVERPGSGTSTPLMVQNDGLLGVRRWRRRFDAIRAALDELELESAAPPAIDHAMAFAARTLEELEESSSVAENHQASVEALANKARDFRATLGRSIDQLAGELSARRGQLEEMVLRRNDLLQRREVARTRLRNGESIEGQADALLWELAAVEEEWRNRAAHCDELEVQVSELRTRLERENEQFEVEIATLVQVLDVEMQRLEGMAVALCAPLQRGEDYVREHWKSER